MSAESALAKPPGEPVVGVTEEGASALPRLLHVFRDLWLKNRARRTLRGYDFVPMLVIQAKNVWNRHSDVGVLSPREP
jgi:hypothetical protein